VYLYGTVDTDLERQNIESLVSQLPNVKEIVNSVDVRNVGR
jgi:osmotically-inducible protein OsmY